MKIRKKYLFFFVFIFLLTGLSKNNVAYAQDAVTPRYAMQFDWSCTYTLDGSSTSRGSGNSVTSFTWNNSKTFQMFFYGSGTNGSGTFYKGGYINSNTVNVATSNSKSVSISISGSSGVVASGSNSVTANLPDGSYTISASFSESYSGYGHSSSTVWRISSSFVIDTTAPTLTVSCGDGGITKSDVTVTYSDGTGAYTKSTSASFPGSSSNSFTSGRTFSEEGNYRVQATDAAGNSSSSVFTIDKTAPSLSLSGVSNGGFTNSNVSASWSTTVGGVGAQRVSSSDVLTVKYSRSTTSSFPSSATTTYSSGTTLSERRADGEVFTQHDVQLPFERYNNV